MRQSSGWSIDRRAGASLLGVLFMCAVSSIMAQTREQASPPQPPPVALLSPDQLDNLVAPIALYPDTSLGQVLAASTYPLEVVEAQQWLQQNRSLDGPRLLEAARQQNWDASVQALVAFPDVLTLLNRDVRWTTDLGNAFLAQQADVMNAVQTMRARAQDNGRLSSTPQQTVAMATQNGQAAIEIQPANPQVIYVPTYNPAYVWGPPAWGAYPALGYPDIGYGFGFNPGVFIGALFAGLLSFGGWGWGLSWLAHALFLNNLFLGHFGFGGYGGGYGRGFGERTLWAHDPGHRLGVPYPNRSVASRFAVGRSNEFANTRSFSAGPFNSGSYNARAYSGAGSAALRSTKPREQSSGWQHFGGSGGLGESPRASLNAGVGGRSFDAAGSRGERGYQSYNRGESYNRGAEGSRGAESQSRYGSPTQGYRSNSEASRGTQTFASNYRSASASARARAPSTRYSAPKASHNSAQHFSNTSHSSHSAPHASSHSGGHSSGHSSGGHSGRHK